MDTRSLPRLPPPKPLINNGSYSIFKSSYKYNELPINLNNQVSTSTLDVIHCQQTLNLHPIGKIMPNRRGRKPLATMPLGKKHMQNLNNQRAFRQRKESYVRNLEAKASDLEMRYNSSQEEIKTLKDRIKILEKKLDSSRSMRNEVVKNVNNNPNSHYGGIVNSAMYHAIIDNHTPDQACDIIMNGVNQIELNDNNIDNPRTSSSSAIYIGTSNDYSTSTTNNISLPVTSVACDPASDERIWIASTSPNTTSPLYSTFVASNPSQNTRDNETSFSTPQTTESQWYFPPTSTAVSTAAPQHPLNLKWILSPRNEE